MNRRLTVLLAVPFLALLVGCGQVQDAASDAAGSAASEVSKAAADQVKSQICTLVEDGLVSIQDKQLLSGLVSTAETAGVPGEITTPLREIADAGDQVPADSVAALNQACASTP